MFIALLVVGALIDKRVFFGFLIAAVILFFVPQVHARVIQLFGPLYWKKAAENGRIARALATFDIMRNNPLFGLGLGHYGGAVAARHFNAAYSDNYYAKTLAETGLLGLISFIAFLAKVVRELHRMIWKVNGWMRGRYVEAGMFTAVFAVILHNAVENIFEVPAMNFLFWLTVSLLFIIGRKDKAEQTLLREEV